MALDVRTLKDWNGPQSYIEKMGLRPRYFPADTHPPDGTPDGPTAVFDIATYNVHRWAGVRGGRAWQPRRAAAVIAELGADVVALQEVLRPAIGPDPLQTLARTLGLHLVFAPTRPHRRGVLGNAILSRWPVRRFFSLDLSFGKIESRTALAVQFHSDAYDVAVVATHLALVDRIRQRQVRTLLSHPELQGPVVLLGDMNAWRQCRATQRLDDAFTERHHNRNWPATYPATRPVLALDRIYARGARVQGVHAYNSAAAQRASDHLPVAATILLDGD